MVIAGWSVHLTTLFSWASLNKQLTSNRAHTFACNWQQPFMNDSAEGRRMTVEIISWSISTKVWDRAGIELATPGSAVSFASVTRHVTDCAMRPGIAKIETEIYQTWEIFTWQCHLKIHNGRFHAFFIILYGKIHQNKKVAPNECTQSYKSTVISTFFVKHLWYYSLCLSFTSSPVKVSSNLPCDKPFTSRPSKFIISAD